MSSFSQGADMLEDLAAIFTPRTEAGGVITASQAAHVENSLLQIAALMRLGERQRVALLGLLGRPVVENDVTVVLTPFQVVQGGRA